jgi:hypothetical protein
MADQFEWQFHFRNFNASAMHVRVHHAGCAGTPWHDDRPCCWNADVPYCPQGLSSGAAVYRPSEWVTDFGDWWAIIKDGLKLIGSVGVLLYPPVTREEVTDVVSNTFAITADVVRACIDDMTDEEINAMLETAHESIEHTCQVNGMDLSVIQQMAQDMNLDPNAWAIIAGKDYRDYIWNSDSPLVNKHGWSVFRGWGPKTKNDLKIAEACFIEKGHLIYPCDGGGEVKYGDTFWKFWSDDFNG